MKKIIAFFKSHRPTKRRLIQIYAALLFNANLKGFATGRIYKGSLKNICTPGLNCYSCPAASGACPLGSLQNSIYSSNKSTLYYVGAILLLYGLFFGRWICSFLCPFGLVQELLHKIPTPKLKKSRVTRALTYLKYVILVFFVILIPLAYAFRDFPLPGFCKYICPAGTLEGALGLLSNAANQSYLGMLGPLFTWKFLLMVSILVAAIFIFRVFCRFLCPLGAIYGLFNRISFVGVKVDQASCTECGICVGKCKMDVRRVGDAECIACGECITACPTQAISFKGPSLLLAPNAIEAEPTDDEIRIAAKKKEVRRGRIARAVLGVLLSVLLVGALVYYNFIDNPAPPAVGIEVGNTCPDITLSLVGEDEDTFTLSENRGRITVLNFWYTTCGPCVEELPHFNDLANEYPASVSVLAIHLDQAWVDLPAWIADVHPEWGTGEMLIAWDTDHVTEQLFGVQACPVTVIVDEDGVITFLRVGSVSEETLYAEVEKAILD